MMKRYHNVMFTIVSILYRDTDCPDESPIVILSQFMIYSLIDIFNRG